VSEVKAAAVTFTFNSDFSLHVPRHVCAGNRALCDVAATAPYGFHLLRPRNGPRSDPWAVLRWVPQRG